MGFHATDRDPVPSLRDPWTEHPNLVKSEAGREIARLRARNSQLAGTLKWLLENDELTMAGISIVREALQGNR